MAINQVQAPCERCGRTVRAGEGVSEKEQGIWKTTHIVCPDNAAKLGLNDQKTADRFTQDFARIFG